MKKMILLALMSMVVSAVSAQGGQEKEEQGDGLPFSSGQPSDIAHQSSGQPSVQMQQAIICPHCKKAMTITVQA